MCIIIVNNDVWGWNAVMMLERVPFIFKTLMVDCQIEMFQTRVYPIIHKLITKHLTLKTAAKHTVYHIAACKHWFYTALQARPPC